MNQSLLNSARKLRLSGLAASLELRLQEAQTHQLSHAQFLELALQDELNVRQQRMLERHKKFAGFRDTKLLEDFDWSFNPSIKRQQIYDLASAQFVRQRQDVLLIGPPGLGKSHLIQAIGQHVIKAGFLVLYCSIFDLVRELQAQDSPAQMDRMLHRYLKPDLLLIDDMGLRSLPPKAGETLLEIILRRYENRSTLMTSNRPIEEWGKLLNDVPAATAILDRFLHHAEIIEITGRSYRLKDASLRLAAAKKQTQNGTSPTPKISKEKLAAPDAQQVSGCAENE